MKSELNDIKKFFGSRLLACREITGLTQEEYGTYIGNITYNHIYNIEKGRHSVGLETIHNVARSFGLEAYEMLNPNFSLPSVTKMPKALRDYIQAALIKREEKKNEPRQKLARYVDTVLASDFLHTPKTAEEFAKHIKGKVETSPGKITTLLTKTKRKEIVQTISGKEWGGNANKYVLKAYYKA